MPNINFYPHPITREGHEVLEATHGQTLAEVLQLNPQQTAVAIVDGAVYDHSVWDTVVLTKSMVIQVRATVHGEDSNPVAIILSLAVIIAAPYLAGAILPAALPGAVVAGFTAGVQVGGILAISHLFPPRLPSTSSGERERQYSLTGGANRARPHEPFLLLLGRHRIFPDLVAQPYTEFSESNEFTSGATQRTRSRSEPEDPFDNEVEKEESSYYDSNGNIRKWNQQFLFQLFDFGIGNIDLSNYRIGETVIGDFNDVETETVDHADLVAGNVDTIQGGELIPNQALVRSTAPNTNKLQYQIVSQRFRYNDQNNIIGEDNVFRLGYRITGTAAWTEFDISVGTANGEDARLPSRRIITREVPVGAYDIRVILQTAINNADTKLHANAAVFAFNAHQPQTGNFSGRNPYAMKIRATGQLSGRVEILSADGAQTIPVWNGNAWVDGPTSNPAWIMRKFWTGWRRPSDNKLMAGRGLALNLIDDENLKRWGAFCDAMELTCNIVIDRLMSTDDIESLIGQCGWASKSQASGKRGMVWENDDEPVTAIFNAANIVADSVDSTYENEGLADEIVGTFVDKDSGYEENTIRRTVPGVGVPERPVDIRLKGITDGTQAAKELNRIAAGQFYHQRIITFEVSSEGHPQYISRGSVIGLAHDLVGGSVGGRLTSIDAGRTQLTSATVVPGAGIIWIWDLNGRIHSTAYAAVGDQITLMDALSPPPNAIVDDPLSYRFMAFDSNTTDPLKVRIVGIEHVGGGNFRITARDEIDQYYVARVADLDYVLLPNRNRYRPVITPLIPPITIGSQQWHFGVGRPPGALGRDGDNYLDTDKFAVWRKIGGLWADIASLAGADGAFWIIGEGPPSDAIGKDGDFYFNRLRAVIWRKVGDNWIPLLDIDGIEPGAVWLSGNGIPPNNIGKNGHYYFQTANGYVWKKVAGAWEFLRDVTGAQGDRGAHSAPVLRIWEPGEELRRRFGADGILTYHGLLRALNEDDHVIRQETGALYLRNAFPFLFVHQYILPNANRAIPPFINNAPDGAIGIEISTRREYLRVNGIWVFQAMQFPGQSLYCGGTIDAAPRTGLNELDTFFIDVGPNRGDYYHWSVAVNDWILTNNVFHVRLPQHWASVNAAIAAHFKLVENNIYPVVDADLFHVADYRSGSGPINLSGDGGDVSTSQDGNYWINDGSIWVRAGNLLTNERIPVNISGVTDPTGTLTASVTEISSGDSITLFWTTERGVTASIDQGIGNLSPVQSGQIEVTPAATTTYTMTVLGADGTTPFEVSVTITVIVSMDPPVILSFTADDTTITDAQSTILRWETTGAITVLRGPGDIGVPLTGSVRVSPNSTITYTLKATNPFGTVTASVRVTVTPSPVPNPVINSLTVSPDSVEGSASVTVTWRTTNAVRIVLEQETSNPFARTLRVDSTTRLDSSETETVSSAGNNRFYLTAYNSDGDTVGDTVTVLWSAEPEPVPDPVIDSFDASPEPTAVGDTITIEWETSNAVRVTITWGYGGGFSGTLVNTTTRLDGSATFTQAVSTGITFFIGVQNSEGDQVNDSDYVAAT